MLKSFFSRKIKAFSIIEIGFSVIILGFFLSFFLRYWNIANFKSKLDETKYKANYIRKSIEGFVVRKGFLPYAAKDLNGIEEDNFTSGYLPYKTLGIPKFMIYDSKGKAFQYIVNQRLALKFVERSSLVLPIWLANNYYPFASKYQLASFKKVFEYESDINGIYELPSVLRHDKAYLESKLEIKQNKKELLIQSVVKFFENFNNPNKSKAKRPVNVNALTIRRIKGEIKDIIAWAIVIKKAGPIDVLENAHEFAFSEKDKVFWQSRFNLAGLSNNHFSMQPLDSSRVFGFIAISH